MTIGADGDEITEQRPTMSRRLGVERPNVMSFQTRSALSSVAYLWLFATQLAGVLIPNLRTNGLSRRTRDCGRRHYGGPVMKRSLAASTLELEAFKGDQGTLKKRSSPRNENRLRRTR